MDTAQTTTAHDASTTRTLRRGITAVAVTAAMAAGLALPASAATPIKATPNPLATPDLPGCYGNLNATFNHGSGVQDHGRDSKGPGYYFRDGQAFQEAKDFTRALFCDAG